MQRSTRIHEKVSKARTSRPPAPPHHVVGNENVGVGSEPASSSGAVPVMALPPREQPAEPIGPPPPLAPYHPLAKVARWSSPARAHFEAKAHREAREAEAALQVPGP
eukprot:5793671-Heterocapsa_arctica.AAC.1